MSKKPPKAKVMRYEVLSVDEVIALSREAFQKRQQFSGYFDGSRFVISAIEHPEDVVNAEPEATAPGVA